MLAALQQEQVAQLAGFAAVADVEQPVAPQRALPHTHHAHLADERVHRHLEHMGQHVALGVGQRHHRGLCFAVQKGRRVAFQRVGQQLDDHVQQLGDAGAAACAGEHHRDQVALAQRLFQRRVQLGRVHIAVVQVAVDKGRVDLDHLLHQRAVCVVHAAEVAVPGAVVETIDHACGALVGQVQRQALTAEAGLDVGQQRGQVHPGCVDAVDDDQPVALALGRPGHHAHRHRLDADRGVDHHRRRLHRLQRRQRLAQAVGRAGGVDQVDATAAMRQVQQRRCSANAAAGAPAGRGR